MLIGYTLGNPEAYEPALDAGPRYKQVGGAWFPDKESALAALDTTPLGHKALPKCWFPDTPLPLPGAVYELHSEGDATGEVDVSEPADEVGARTLKTRARLQRCSE